MYSERVREFISSHRPPNEVWDFETVQRLADKAGLEIHPFLTLDRLEVVATEGPFKKGLKWWSPAEGRSNRMVLERDRSLEVTWRPQVAGSTLVFTPQIMFGRGEAATRLLQAAGLVPVPVELSEPVITIRMGLVDLTDGIETVETVFISEIPTRLQPFAHELARLIKQRKAQSSQQEETE